MVHSSCFSAMFHLNRIRCAFADVYYWTTKAPMLTARDRAAVAVVNGKIWVLGGSPAITYPPSAIATVEVYDPTTNSWDRKPALSEPRTLSGCVSQGNYMYVIGGSPGMPVLTNTVLRYDTTNGTTTQIGTLATNRARCAAILIDADIYVIGGITAGGPPGFVNPPASTVEVFDLVTNQVTATFAMPGARDMITAVAAGTDIYALGGFDGVNI